MAKNDSLIDAARAKKDKFYTQLEDIELELRHYREFFKGKSVLCNCDDPFESNFFQYFALKFNDLELKKLVTTSYADSPIAGLEINLFPDGKTAYMTEVTELRDWNGDGREDLNDVKFAIEHGLYKVTPLTGDNKYCAGDFRSKELVDLLKACDVVVTNPPFSVFREYVKLMFDSGKKFVILGNMNAITYKEIFPLIMANKLWLGESIQSGDREFRVPDDYPLEAANFRVDEDGIKYLRIKGVRWYTNFDISKFREDIPLFKSYREEPERYPKYDNYDAINVDKTSQIPVDYFGVMGVPISFLDRYNPDQFEILGIANSARWIGYECFTIINGRRLYNRILIRRRQNCAVHFGGDNMIGIDDEKFIRGEVPMTKREIRVLTLAAARIDSDSVVVDVGAGTGSITVEAALLAQRGKVFAVERKLEAVELIKRNVEKFSVANVEIICAQAPDGLNDLPELDAAIVGGTGGQLDEILSALNVKLKIGGRIVVNAVTIQTVANSLDWFHARGWNVDASQVQITRLKRVGQLDMNAALNPVWIVAAEKN